MRTGQRQRVHVGPPRRSGDVTGDTPAPAAMRNEYAADLGLTEADLAADWHRQFDSWFADAVAFGLPEPNAMVVGTADAAGRPSGRTVLLKGYDPEGFVFFTNHLSRKGVEASANPYASLVFPWFPMQRQVVVAGSIAPVDPAVTESYFASRPRGSQLGAWASPQSQVVPDRAALEERYREVAERFADATVIPPPPHWGGLRVRPDSVEFWQGRAGRLHDRLRFRRVDGSDWIVERLAP
ncbi:pyridoxamine 5'-phosphate oxidase [Micromonospora sp. NPDC047557]|uniref:pyridoxamine 5'-phosphate oxidase n=1 Tax=Micromonospora sp. NPDC047557 TaxID=3364250 RepID=UPI003714130C